MLYHTQRHRGLILGTFFAITILVLSCATATTVQAKQELRFSPLLIESSAKPGEHFTEPITLTSAGDEAITVELNHMDFGFDGNSYEVVLINDKDKDTTAFSTRGWFSLPQKRYLIPAGQSIKVDLQINVPKNQNAGTHLGAAIFRIVPPKNSQKAAVHTITQGGPLVFISVLGGKPPKPKISTFSVPKIQRSGPIRPTLRIKNLGDEFFTVEGKITLEGAGLKKQQDIRRQVVVPHHPRNVQALLPRKTKNALEAPLKLGTNALGFGRYKVKLRLRVEPTGTTLTTSRVVWIVPLWAYVVTLLIATTIAALIILMVRRVQKRKNQRYLPIQESPHSNELEDEQDELEDEHSDEDSWDENEFDDEHSDED